MRPHWLIVIGLALLFIGLLIIRPGIFPSVMIGYLILAAIVALTLYVNVHGGISGTPGVS